MNVPSPHPTQGTHLLETVLHRKQKFPSAPDLMWNKLAFLSSELSGFLEKSC